LATDDFQPVEKPLPQQIGGKGKGFSLLKTPPRRNRVKGKAPESVQGRNPYPLETLCGNAFSVNAPPRPRRDGRGFLDFMRFANGPYFPFPVLITEKQ